MRLFELPSEEELNELHKKELERLKANPNNLSFWFPKVKDCGIAVPKTVIVPIPDELESCFYQEHPSDREKIFHFVKTEILPKIKTNFGPRIFIKNGCFSDKFNFKNCYLNSFDEFNLTSGIMAIQYDSLLFETDGHTELVLREFIDYDETKIPTIYNGMPLRPEFRVFYDFTEHKLLYSVNYWDWNYCYSAISRNATDKLVYEQYYPTIEKYYTQYKEKVEDLINNAMKQVDLSDTWSIDILYDSSTDTFWLIDMALASHSAYWDPKK